MRLVFGDCEFDSGRRVLLRHGRVEALSPKAFQFLEFLLDRRPEVIAKTEILTRLWPDTFVADGSLHNVVAEVRAALGDSPQRARYIRTVPRYGYAFHADAEPVPEVGGETRQPGGAGHRLAWRRREWALSAGPNVVGRDPDCAVRLDSHTVSRRHANVVVTGGTATLEDLGSKNGTHLNNQLVVQRVALEDGDRIRVGSETMTYRVSEVLPSTLTERSK